MTDDETRVAELVARHNQSAGGNSLPNNAVTGLASSTVVSRQARPERPKSSSQVGIWPVSDSTIYGERAYANSEGWLQLWERAPRHRPRATDQLTGLLN
jgi:hypothetical protein